jgi:hypothetical protein
LLYYQQDQRTLERLSAAGRNTPRRSSPAQPGRWGPGVESAADVLDEAALGLDPEKPLLIYNPEICGTEVVGWVKR